MHEGLGMRHICRPEIGEFVEQYLPDFVLQCLAVTISYPFEVISLQATHSNFPELSPVCPRWGFPASGGGLPGIQLSWILQLLGQLCRDKKRHQKVCIKL